MPMPFMAVEEAFSDAEAGRERYFRRSVLIHFS